MENLLTRDEFRNAVFERDMHKCVFCGSTENLDAHHILERRLFTHPSQKGGYFISNGATVCQQHHLECEMTTITVEQVREACGILKFTIPEHLYDDQTFDKWGNIILPNGNRMKGELFHDESVQKILKKGDVLKLFTKYVKHPRLHHFPWSDSMTSDDRYFDDLSHFEGKEVVVSMKMDGEQSTAYNDYFHARSIDGINHPSRDRVKAFAAQWQWNLADNQRICGENVYAQHSIIYDEGNPLPHYFLGFSMWEDMTCLSWDDTMDNFEILGITPVPVMWRGIWDEKVVRSLYDPKRDWNTVEGYVVRLASSFSYGKFRHSVAKYVRKDHIRTVKQHWRSQPVIPNTFLNE